MPSSEITSYWDERSVTYSNGVKDELADHRRAAWETVLDAIAPFEVARAAHDKRPRVVDLGCGPGFFSVIPDEENCFLSSPNCSLTMA